MNIFKKIRIRKEAKRFLKAARALMQNEECWYGGDPLSRELKNISYCPITALVSVVSVAERQGRYVDGTFLRSKEALLRAAGVKEDREFFALNDDPNCTHDEIMQVMNKAITIA